MNQTNIEKLARLSPDEKRIIELQGQVAAVKASRGELQKTIKYWQGITLQRQKDLDVALAIKEETKPRTIKHRRSMGTSESTAVMVASDWHVEEQVLPGSVNGLNEFNLEIAEERINSFFVRGLKLINIWRAGTKIDTLVLALLGDFMSGYIHEDLQESNELSPVEAILWLQERIVGGIQYLQKEGGFKQIIIPCCIGNHGRTTEKRRVSQAHRNNYEWLMFNNLALMLQGGKCKTHFQIPQSYFTYLDVYDRTIRFHHGDYIGYQGGIGGISIPLNKAIAKWNEARHAWMDVLGHWHQAKDEGHWVINNSLIGFAPYSIKVKGVFSEPSQTLFFIEKEHGRTSIMPILVK